MAWNMAGADFAPASDRALLVSLGNRITPEAHLRVAALARRLAADPIPHVSNIHPAYCSVLLVFDPLRIDHEQVAEGVAERLEAAGGAPAAPRMVEIPVCYGGEFGPDLEAVAALHEMTPLRLVEIHSSAIYVAQFLGVAPGFAYLSGLADELATPRLDTPRAKVPAGSVAIAGKQAGVYPFETPGGWRVLGRTPLEVFRADRAPANLIGLDDRVRFRPITRRQFEEAVR